MGIELFHLCDQFLGGELVVQNITDLVEKGIYPEKLW